MNLKVFETIQRAENGGSPLSNETADFLDMGHGSPVVILPKRQFVALLKRAQEAVLSQDKGFVEEIDVLLKEHDQFVFKVSSKEIA